MNRLRNKTAVITGATSGIGEASARLFAEEGANVVFAGRRADKGKALEAEISALIREFNTGGEVLFVQADVSKEEDVKALFQAAADKFGGIDILVNNAGVTPPQFDAEDFQAERDFDFVMNVNTKAYFTAVKYAVPYLAKNGGAIVNVASVAAVNGAPGLSAYAASKGAVLAYSKTLAAELAPKRIRVNTILPGLTNSEMVPKGSEFEKMSIPGIPMGRAAEPREIANGILFFASEDSSFCTGVQLLIDGGMTLM
jgi:NAD(P)-dependent dehydrogenase (short-subunit alcohol dehydrogenase family)